jgi:hypothetical protein
MGIKDLLLNKGWAGNTLSRAETVDHLNPLIRSLTTLMHGYDAAQPTLEGDQAESLEQARKLIRGDLGKLAETVLSSGGVAYSGVDQEPSVPATGDAATVFEALKQLEEAFRTELDAERTVEHQIRTRAVLENVARNSTDRLGLLRDLAR